MPDKSKRSTRNAEETRGKIVEAAQRVFAEKGYPHAGLREIAKRAGVAVSLIIKHFGSKARLFDEALTSALIDPEVFQSDRERFGRTIVDAVGDPEEPMLAPTMIALSLGDAEARGIIERVTRDRILAPMAAWLGDPAAAARAKAILMLTTGYALVSRHLGIDQSEEARQGTADLMAETMQALIDDASRT